MRFTICKVIGLTLIVTSLIHPAQAGLFGNKDSAENKTAPTAPITAPNRPGSFADLAEALLPTVVNISSTVKSEPHNELTFGDVIPQFPNGSPFEGSPFEDFFEQFMDRQIPNQPQGQSPSLPSSAMGSGFVIDAEKGYIITNNHVIKDADEVQVTFANDETATAEVIGSDEKTDLAVLKIDPKDLNLTEATFGNSDTMRVGDWILAIGNPFGLGGTVTAGIISARARDIQSGPYDDYLQTDASINRGNSGGPMFNLAGEVIGINTAIFSPTGGSVGIGFAIPSTQASAVINQLIEFGQTRRGWLGVRIQEVTDEIAESLGLEETKGALVASVTKDGPAEKAGVEAGDIVIKFNGKPIKEMRELPRIVAETRIESDVTITVLNKGKEKTLTVKVGELEKAEKDGRLGPIETSYNDTGTVIDDLGITVETITDTLRDEFAIAESITEGIVITDTDPNGEAMSKGIIPGDVITEINQQAIKKPSDLTGVIKAAKRQKRGSILLLLNRDSDVRFVALKLKADE